MERSSNEKEFLLRPAEAASAWRIGFAIFSLVISAQAIWMLLGDLQYSRRGQIPISQSASGEAALERAQTKRAAELAVVRGEFWAESAFTYSELLWTEPASANRATVEEARISVERALRYSPHRGDVWLLLAAMASRYDWQGYKPSALLKMSYYTAPNEQVLFLFRIKVALTTAGHQDAELADMIARDIRLVITRTPAQKRALALVYKEVPASERQFIERVVLEVAPAYLADMRAGSQ